MILKPVKGWPGYCVSFCGKVYSFKSGNLKLLQQQPTDRGYLRVKLSNRKKRNHFKVHRLVALAFIPNPEKLPTVDHEDRDRANNHGDNLKWASMLKQSQNRSRWFHEKKKAEDERAELDYYYQSGQMSEEEYQQAMK